jgi:diacylglycerol kinase family enzyme
VSDPGRRIVLMVNPACGRHDPRALARLAELLGRTGAVVETVASRGPGDLALRLPDLVAGGGFDTVAVAGGDGTVDEVVGAVTRLPPPWPRLVVVPQGTADVLAVEHRLPRDPAAIAAAIGAGRTRPIHLGTARTGDGASHPFVLMASVGIDAEVVAAVERRRFRPLKKLAFVLSAVRLARQRRQRFTVEATVVGETEPRRFAAALAIVAKAAHYGGPFVLTRRTASDRPGLVLVALADDRPAKLVAAAIALLRGRLEAHPEVVSFAVERIRITAVDGPRAVQIDGEPAGIAPLEVTPSSATIDLVVAAPDAG